LPPRKQRGKGWGRKRLRDIAESFSFGDEMLSWKVWANTAAYLKKSPLPVNEQEDKG
jgi:hypothetical protein